MLLIINIRHIIYSSEISFQRYERLLLTCYVQFSHGKKPPKDGAPLI